MRNPLQKFTEFTGTLLPHETSYLLEHQSFADPNRRQILERIDYNCRCIYQFTSYDTDIDKRTYSHLKSWIINRLRTIDVDVQYEWISDLDRKIMTDSILPSEERMLLKTIRRYQHPWFFFTKFYELVQHYRQFLLVRIRYSDHAVTDDFLKTYSNAYRQSKAIYADLHAATQDIVNQYRASQSESIQWERWLSANFYDEQLDGLNRYQALVRLNFIGFNYRKFDGLLEKFDYLDDQFKQGKYYSKRLLLNYYGNRLLLHSKFREFEKATYYGYLSIRAKNHDYLYYLTNLCAILLRQKKVKDALAIMKQGAADAKSTQNMHCKIGYVAFYTECLNASGEYANAEVYAQTYLQAFAKEIKEYRWHLFFSAYLKSLLQQGKYAQMLAIIRQHQLLDHDRAYEQRANYLPTIAWFHATAEYREGYIQRAELEERLKEYARRYKPSDQRQYLIRELLALVRSHL